MQAVLQATGTLSWLFITIDSVIKKKKEKEEGSLQFQQAPGVMRGWLYCEAPQKQYGHKFNQSKHKSATSNNLLAHSPNALRALNLNNDTTSKKHPDTIKIKTCFLIPVDLAKFGNLVLRPSFVLSWVRDATFIWLIKHYF